MKNQLTGQEITNDELLAVSQMCHRQKYLETTIAIKNEELTTLNEQLRQLSEVSIPESMMALGLSEIKLNDGSKVEVKKFYSAKIPDDRGEEAFKWLRDEGHDDLIKNTITLNFGKGEDETARLVSEELIKRGLTPEQKIFVHSQTLKAFVREQIENANTLPLDLFGVYVGNKTKITSPKK